MSIFANVTGTASLRHPDDALSETFLIDPDVVRQRLAQGWAFATSWWEQHDPYRRHDPLDYTLGLHDVGTRAFAKRTKTPGSITVPPACPDNPLLVFDRPRRIGRGELGNPSAEIERACRMLERRFEERRNRW